VLHQPLTFEEGCLLRGFCAGKPPHVSQKENCGLCFHFFEFADEASSVQSLTNSESRMLFVRDTPHMPIEKQKGLITIISPLHCRNGPLSFHFGGQAGFVPNRPASSSSERAADDLRISRSWIPLICGILRAEPHVFGAGNPSKPQ
jgi:hypothetical protein